MCSTHLVRVQAYVTDLETIVVYLLVSLTYALIKVSLVVNPTCNAPFMHNSILLPQDKSSPHGLYLNI